jgi:hypothetical protein
MLTPANRFLVVLNLSIVALGCYDGDDLVKTDAHPAFVAPQHGNPPDAAAWPSTKPVLSGRLNTPPPPPGMEPPVEFVQQQLAGHDTDPAMTACPTPWGAPAAQAYTQLFRHAYPFNGGQATLEECKTARPNSHYPNLSASGHTYPSGIVLNDNIRAFYVWVNPGNGVRVTFKEHPDWWFNGGASLTYEVHATTGIASAGSPDIQVDAGFAFQATQVTVTWLVP